MNKILFAALASATLAFTSCADDFLDRQPQGSYVDNEQTASAKDWNPQVLLGNINACSSKWSCGQEVTTRATLVRNSWICVVTS